MTPGKVNTSDNASNADLSLSTEVSQRDDATTSEAKDVKKPIVSFESDISNSIEKTEQKNIDTIQKTKPMDERLKLEVNIFTISLINFEELFIKILNRFV